MVEVEHNEVLGDMLVNLGRSLLQYTGEAWPWIDVTTRNESGSNESGDNEHSIIEKLVTRQKSHVARLVALLSSRGQAIDFGTYPTEYTDLHYVSLDYLLSQLIESEQSLVDDAQRTLKSSDNDVEAATLLEAIIADQRDSVAQLQTLAKSRKD